MLLYKYHREILILITVFSNYVTKSNFVTSNGALINAFNALNIELFGYQVSLRDSYLDHFCGGSIISDRFIITAAHCVIRTETHRKRDKKHLKVVAGQLLLSLSNKSLILDVSHIEIYSHYKHNDENNMADDIAVVQLLIPLDLKNPNVSTIQLKRSKIKDPNCITLGWGLTDTDEKGKVSDTLRQDNYEVITNKECQEKYGSSSEILETVICAGNTTNNIGKGDSGGPLVCDLELAGIISVREGISKSGEFPPGVFTRVSEYYTWIQDQINATIRGDRNEAVKLKIIYLSYIQISVCLIIAIGGCCILRKDNYNILYSALLILTLCSANTCLFLKFNNIHVKF